MAKMMISKGLLYGLDDSGAYSEIFDSFFAQGDRTLEDGIDDLPLWFLCRASVVDSFVLRQFSSDCIEFTGPTLAPGDGELVAVCVDCARSYAARECDHEFLLETQQRAQDRKVDNPVLSEHALHFFNVVQFTLAAHPDAGALQCITNLPRCFDQIGEDSVALQAWIKAAFRQRCQEAGFFE